MTKLTALPGWVRVDGDNGVVQFIRMSHVSGIGQMNSGNGTIWLNDIDGTSVEIDGHTPEDLWRVVEEALRLERERVK